MARRLTDTDKWKKPFIKGLSATYKLLWFYICDDCDHAGIWQVDFDVARIRIGEQVDADTAIEVFGENIRVIDGAEKWFIPSFIEFQYSCKAKDLNPENKVHNSVIRILNKYSLLKNKAHPSPMEDPIQGSKDKDKDKDKDKGITTSEVESTRGSEFQSKWDDWLDYRKEIKKPYKSRKSILAQLHKLASYSDEEAIDMIEQSIRYGWQGIFPVKPESNGTQKQQPNPGKI